MQRTKHEEALMSQLANLEQAVVAKKKELAAYRESQAGVSVGSIVVNEKGERCRVASIDARSFAIYLKVNALKKDGTWGNRATHLWGKWTVEKSDAGE